MQFFELMKLLLVELLVLRDVILILLLLVLLLFDLLLNTGSIWDPIVVAPLVRFPYEDLLDSILFFGLPPEIEEVVDVAQLIVSLANMFLEALQFEIDLEPLLSTNKAVR
jgi:hypothetical protein